MNEEEALVRSFVVPAKRQRLLELLANPRRRSKATQTLAHFRGLDPRWLVALPPDRQDPASIGRELRYRGAGPTCHVVSEDREVDGRQLPLAQVLGHVVGRGFGTLVSCVPGQLVYFEGEGPSDRWILARPPT